MSSGFLGFAFALECVLVFLELELVLVSFLLRKNEGLLLGYLAIGKSEIKRGV